jgi:hypothetical protein
MTTIVRIVRAGAESIPITALSSLGRLQFHRYFASGGKKPRYVNDVTAKKNAGTRPAQVLRQVSYRQETYRAVTSV